MSAVETEVQPEAGARPDPAPAATPPTAPANPNPTPASDTDPKWLDKRLSQKERSTRETVAREFGYESFEAMQAAAEKIRQAAQPPDSDPNRPPANANDAKMIVSLRQRVAELERLVEKASEDLQQERGLWTIEKSAMQAGISNPTSLRIVTVMFSDHMDSTPQLQWDGITPDQLSERAGAFFKSLRAEHGALFDQLGPPRISSGPPAGAPPPATPTAGPTDDFKLSRKDYEKKARAYESVR